MGVVAFEHREVAADRPVTGLGGRARALLDLLDTDRLVVHHQPILDLDGDGAWGLEVLARPQLTHQLRGPGDAFAVADRLGRTSHLDAIYRRSALADLVALERPAGVGLHLNLAVAALAERAVTAASLTRQVEAAGLDPAEVVLELHPHQRVDLRVLGGELTALRAAGFRLALEEVGGPGSGLGPLEVGGLDLIKLAGTVTRQLGVTRHARAVLRAVGAYAASIDAGVVVTDVQTGAQLALVREVAAELPAGVLRGVQGRLLAPASRRPWAPMSAG